MEKGVKQESSYPLLVMKRDQTNKTNVDRVYGRWPLVWEPGPDGSSVDLQSFQEWVRHSHTSHAHTHRSWSGMEVEWKRTRSDGSGGQKGTSQGVDKGEETRRRAEGMSYHDRLVQISAH